MKLKLLFLFLVIATLSFAQKKDSIVNRRLIFQQTLFDIPYQFDAAKTVNNGQLTGGSFFAGYANPSMHQSLDVSANLYTGLMQATDRLFKYKTKKEWKAGKKTIYYLTLLSENLILSSAPGFDGWMHEEYHRAVMSRFQVNSFNDMNRFPIGASSVSVNHINDDDLIRMKQESPADFCRMQVAGIEGEYLLIERLQKNNFYYQQDFSHQIFYWLTTLNSIFYVRTCSNPDEADPETIKMNETESDIAQRDFTGLDFLGWTRDLFRPDEPYETRGVHPLGNGIDRYTQTTDLTSEELSYLKRQGNLQLLNLLSPMLIGIEAVKINNQTEANFAVRHLLTSFGNDISCNLFLKNNKNNYFIALHNYNNYHSYFPGIELQYIDYTCRLMNSQMLLSPRVVMGLQPSNQSFTTKNASFLGLLECKAEFSYWKYIYPFVELSAKTEGWIAGNEFLNQNFSCRFGISSRINF